MDSQKLKLINNDISKILPDITQKINGDICGKINIFNDLYKMIDSYISDKYLNLFLKEKFKNFNYKILKTKHTKFLLYVSYYSCKNKQDFFQITQLIAYVYYVTYINKNLKYCNKQLLHNTIAYLKATHTFRKFGIIDGIRNLSTTVYKYFKPKIEQDCENPLMYIKFVYALRTAIVQSTRSLIIKYFKLKETKQTIKKYDDVIDVIFRNIMFYGYIPKPKQSQCSQLYNKFLKLPYIDENLVKDSISEVINLYGIENITHQKITKNIDKLIVSRKVLEQLGIPVTRYNLLCYVYIIINTYLSRSG